MALSLNPVSDDERNLLFDNGAISSGDNSDFELPDWVSDERRGAVQALGSSLPNVRDCHKLLLLSISRSFIFKKSEY